MFLLGRAGIAVLGTAFGVSIPLVGLVLGACIATAFLVGKMLG